MNKSDIYDKNHLMNNVSISIIHKLKKLTKIFNIVLLLTIQIINYIKVIIVFDFLLNLFLKYGAYKSCYFKKAYLIFYIKVT